MHPGKGDRREVWNGWMALQSESALRPRQAPFPTLFFAIGKWGGERSRTLPRHACPGRRGTRASVSASSPGETLLT